MKRLLFYGCMVLLFLIVLTAAFKQYRIINFKKQDPAFSEIQKSQVDVKVQQWAKNKKDFGVYLYKFKPKGPGGNFLVYSKKKLQYNYHMGKATKMGEILRLDITTHDASNDSDAKSELFMNVTIKEAPEYIQLFIDGKQSNFKEITSE